MAGPMLRLLVASEHAEARRMLTEALGRESGVTVVGQAENGLKAITLAERLRPDIAVVDSQLPHFVGMDSVRLSRTGGLDTAQTIAQGLPRTAVVLVNDLGMAFRWGPHAYGSGELSLYDGIGSIPLKLMELAEVARVPNALVFASYHIREGVATSRAIELCDRATLYGGLAVLGGLGLMLTAILAAAGVVLVLGGIGVMMFSLLVRISVASWLKRHFAQRPNNRQAYESAEAYKTKGA